MIEQIIYEYLNSTLNVPAYLEMPAGNNVPDEFVLIERTGGGVENHLKNAIFAIQSHAKSLHAAAALNESVKDAMENIVILSDISSCGLNSDYNYTDGGTKNYRYQAVFNIFHY